MGTAGQHAAHGTVAVDELVLEGGQHVQNHQRGEQHVQPVVHAFQGFRQRRILGDQAGSWNRPKYTTGKPEASV